MPGPATKQPNPSASRPTSYSEINAWSVCRQKWHWLYARGIEPRVAKRTPSLGSCGHAALAAFMAGQDWQEAIRRWLKTEVSARQLFDEEIEEFENLAHMVMQIMPRYIAHWKHDLQTVAVEVPFEVAIPRTTHRLQGYFDAIVQDNQGHYWLMESKFPGQFRTEDDIDLDGQLGVYHYAAQQSGFPVIGIIYNQILAKVPSIPKRNQDGSFSRAAITCDWLTYRQHVEQAGQDPASYIDMQLKLQNVEFFRRYYRARTDQEVKNFANNLAYKVWDLRRNRKHVYMSESRINCNVCPFKELCLATLKGEDLETLIQLSYQPRRSRRDELLSANVA